ncbi:MAG: hypothetical protein ABFS16_16450 [Bacteroidota bacterium]
MKKIIFIIACLFIGFYGQAQNKTNKVNQIRVTKKVDHNVRLEQNAFIRSHKIDGLLTPDVKKQLDKITQELFNKMVSETNSVDYDSFVKTKLRRNFKNLSEEQSNLLEFHVLSEVAQIISDQDELESKLNNMNEMSEMTSLRLQMTMDRRSKFISTLSQIMKKISSTQDSLVQNIK